MRFSRQLLALVLVGAAACGPTYVVQSAPTPAPQRVPVPPRVEPLGVSIVRPEDGRVLVQTSRPAYVAVFEIVPGRGVSLVYPQPYRPRDLELTGLTWVNVSWTMRYDYDRRWASYDTRYIYAVGSDTPLRVEDSDYNTEGLQRRLGSTFYSSSPNATVRAISREFVRGQPDEWWGEDLFSMYMGPSRDRIVVTIRMARVYCPGGHYFEVREDLVDRVWCPARVVARGRPPVTEAPDSVFGSNGRRVPRHMDPTARTPVFRVPAATDVGQQQGQPHEPPRNGPPVYPPRTQPNNPQIPTTNQPQTPPENQPPRNQPPQNQPPQNQPPQMQPPAQTPPQNQPPQTQPQDTSDKGNNGRRAHGDPRNADPRGNGNGYGNGGRTQQPSTRPPATQPPQSNPQPQQQGQGQGQQQNQPNSNGHGNGNGNNANSGNNANNGNHGNDAKPNHDNAPKNSISDILNRGKPQASQKPQDDKTKKAASDSTDKKKP